MTLSSFHHASSISSFTTPPPRPDRQCSQFLWRKEPKSIGEGTAGQLDCPPRNHVGLANWPAVPSPMDFGSFRHRNCEHCRSGLGGGVVKDEIELAWWKLLSVINIEQIEVDHHHLAVTDLAERLKHQIHPNTLARAVDLLSDIACLSAQFQG